MASSGGGSNVAEINRTARLEEEEAERVERENKARLRNLRSRNAGRRALLAFVDSVSGDGGRQLTLG